MQLARFIIPYNSYFSAILCHCNHVFIFKYNLVRNIAFNFRHNSSGFGANLLHRQCRATGSYFNLMKAKVDLDRIQPVDINTYGILLRFSAGMLMILTSLRINAMQSIVKILNMFYMSMVIGVFKAPSSNNV